MTEPFQILPATVAKLFDSLLGRKVTAKPAPAQVLKAPNKHFVAEYSSDQGGLEAVWICDLPLGCNLAAALTMLPAQAAAQSAYNDRVDGPLAENFQELANIVASLFNGDGRAHVALRKVWLPGTPLPAEVTAAVKQFTGQAHLELTVPGYVGGKLSLMHR